MGLGYDLWVTTISDAIDNIEDIDTIMDAFGVVDNLNLFAINSSILTFLKFFFLNNKQLELRNLKHVLILKLVKSTMSNSL